MSEFDLVIRKGKVATASDVMDCDVGVREGRIAALGAGLGKGAQEIDAAGKWVLPGGIDAHCHIDQLSSAGITTSDDFFTGSRSAACGGTTTIIPFAAQHRGQSLRQVVQDYHARAEGKAVVDYAFHLIISDASELVLKEELPALIRDGYTSFKIYLTYDLLRLQDRQVLEVMDVARNNGALVMVHAENHDVISWLTERLLAEGKSAPKYHAVSHAAAAEREATHRAIALAEVVDVPVLIVHVSGRDAMEQIRWAQARNMRVYGETCPQYLFLSAEDMDRPGFEGAKYICSPPPREKANQEAIWQGLETGVFQIVSSDHAPYRFDEGGKKHHGENAPFNRVANGIPGLEVRLPLLFSEGVGKGRLSINAFVALTATNAAKLYGIYPRKGTIAVGSDADIAIWDEQWERTISIGMLHDAMDYTPYEGMTVRGWPTHTISRGEVVWQDEQFVGEAGRGVFLPCEPPRPARPSGSAHDLGLAGRELGG
ncbi:MAG: dihydropyrimidinase [SAR324 cluster bacterium]|nr:dihydropyrimidinase [SAR324 cluster bacterium]